jgi:hypothetical protein
MKRISKEQHVERMGERAVRRAKDAHQLVMAAYDFGLEKLREARRRNGVGRPPQKS